MAAAAKAHTRAEKPAGRRYEPAVPMAAIVASKTNPRVTFHEKSLGELAESLKQDGMKVPILMRPLGKRYEIVDGERRWRAAKLAGLATVPGLIEEMSDVKALELQIIANDQRADVHPLEQALGYRRLLEAAGDTPKGLAARIQKGESWVRQMLKLSDLCEAGQKAFRERAINLHQAVRIARIPGEAHQEGALEECRRGATVRELQEWIHRELHHDIRHGGFDAKDAGLVKGAPACAECPKLSANCAALYPELKGKATICTDAACYEQKREAHLDREIAAAKKAGEPLALIRVGYDYWPRDERREGTLDDGEYKTIGGKEKACDSARKALVVHGRGVGKTVEICCDRKCKVHGGGGPSAWDEKWKKEQAAERKRIETDKVVRGRIVDALLAAVAVPEDLTLAGQAWLTDRLEEWIEAVWERLGRDTQALIRKRHPEWDADTIPVGDLLLPGLARLMEEIVLAPELVVWGYGEKGVSKELRERCEAAGVDWRGIEAEVKAERAAPKKASGKSAGPASGIETAIARRGDWLRISARLNTPRDPAEPDADGMFAPDHYTVVDSKLAGCTARVYLVQCGDGWRQSHEVDNGESREGGYPNASGLVYPSPYLALLGGLDAIVAGAGDKNGSSKKALAAERKIAAWVDDVRIEAVAAQEEWEQMAEHQGQRWSELHGQEAAAE